MATIRTIPFAARDPRVDAYIAQAADFARPILAHLRDVVHAACPEVEETIKWSRPFFDYRGGMLCHMAAFKAHAALGFWHGKAIPDLPSRAGGDGMGNLGRIMSLDDLPSRRELTSFIRAAMRINENTHRPVRAKSAPKAALAMPADFATALFEVPEASRVFATFSPSARRDYVEWVTEAKREATRTTRIATAVGWIADGRTRHWEYHGR